MFTFVLGALLEHVSVSGPDWAENQCWAHALAQRSIKRPCAGDRDSDLRRSSCEREGRQQCNRPLHSCTEWACGGTSQTHRVYCLIPVQNCISWKVPHMHSHSCNKYRMLHDAFSAGSISCDRPCDVACVMHVGCQASAAVFSRT